MSIDLKRARRAAAFALLLTLPAAALATSREDAATTNVDEAVGWLQGYLRIDTTNPPGGEAAAAAYLARILHQEGISTQLLVTPDGRTNLYARLPAQQPTGGALLLLHHMDVVPAGETWTRDPFSAEILDGKIWGRGAIDAKSLGVSHLAAMIDLARRQVPLARDVVFLAVADEENGGGQGMGWLIQEHTDLFADVAGVLNEGGSNRAAGDRLFWWGIEVAQKRPLWLRVTTRGRGGHGSTYNPFSATHQLVVSLANLFRQPREPRVTKAAADYFRAISTFHGDAFRDVFDHPDTESVQLAFDRMREEGRSGKVMLPGMLAFFIDTIQITSLQSPNDTVNVVPQTASALLDIRLLPDTPVEAALSWLREGMGQNPAIEVLLSSPPTSPSPTDSAIYRGLDRILGKQATLVPSFITGTTDSRYFRERGVPAYGFSPFVLNGEEVRGIHGPDESIPIQKFRSGLETMRRVVGEIAAR